jgi:AcrR family transcriptional regulator
MVEATRRCRMGVMSTTGGASPSQEARPSRPYDNTLRRSRAAGTRDRIISAGCDLLLGTSIRDWRGLTIRAVAERADVNESTVFRHFGSERGLKDAVMRGLEKQAGIDLDKLGLDDVADVAARIFDTVSVHPVDRRTPLDSTLAEAGRRQREALQRAVAPFTSEWSQPDREVAAAMFDVLWGVGVYERLAVDWELDHVSAVSGITWVIELIDKAIRQGERPGAEPDNEAGGG